MFVKDSFTTYYTCNIIETLNKQWSEEKIKVVLDIIAFLLKYSDNPNNVKSLETIMDSIDANTQVIISELF
jgi:accessory colonization factor AcfC